jgi:UDP-glucuronate 4-epimerase
LKPFKNFTFYKEEISDRPSIEFLFKKHNIGYVINLAAQAGVRYSIDNPDVYIQSNIIGFHNILELCRYYPVKHLIYASSSSVYGANVKIPFEETDFVDHPVSLYAATKKSNELMAYAYSHLYNIPSTGLRFFTVYGPLGRPDMAYFTFLNDFFSGISIKIYNNGDITQDLMRDFTFIDDVIEGLLKAIYNIPENIKPKHRILNIGNGNPISLMNFITILEKSLSKSLGKIASFKKIFELMRQGDVKSTFASTTELEKLTKFKPKTLMEDGIQQFTDWYVNYYNKRNI